MSKLLVKKGTTSKLTRIFVQDSSKVDGSGLTGLLYNSASLTWYYIREGAASPTQVTLATMTVGTWATGGFKEIDATNMPGWYELGVPDAVLASGASSVAMHLKGATNMAPVPLEIQLTNPDWDDGTRFGLTALPNANAAAAGGLLTFGTGAGQINPNGAGAVTTTYALKKNAALSAFPFVLYSSTDHVTPKTGATVTAQRSIDGAAFGACANAVSEVGSGLYVLNLAAGDLNGNCIVLKFSATGADTVTVIVITQS